MNERSHFVYTRATGCLTTKPDVYMTSLLWKRQGIPEDEVNQLLYLYGIKSNPIMYPVRSQAVIPSQVEVRILPPDNQPIGKKTLKSVYGKGGIKHYKSSMPVVKCTRVVIKYGLMTLSWFGDDDSGGWNINTMSVLGIKGECDICVPTKTLKDVIRILDGYDFSINQDVDCMLMIIKSVDSIIKIKGIDSQEWPEITK